MSFYNVEVKKKKKRQKSGFSFCVFKVDENKTIQHKPSSVGGGGTVSSIATSLLAKKNEKEGRRTGRVQKN